MAAQTAHADSASWNLNPTSNDWNTAANWTPETVPNAQADVATFNASNLTAISVASIIEVDSIVFNIGASSCTFTISENNPVGYIAFYGAGVINNSGLMQYFQGFAPVGFYGTATAGIDVVYTNRDVGNPFSLWIGFVDHSTAGSATFINVGDSPGLREAGVRFNDFCSAADSTIINEAGDTLGGGTSFWGSSTAGNSTITSYRNGGVGFFDSATGGNATLIVVGGLIRFEYASTGGMARVELLDGGVLDLSANDKTGPTTIGSLEGDSTGTVLLGARHGHQLTIGGNGLSTTFTGRITQTGSLLKTGNETLTLTGPSTYTGGTTIAGGTLLAQATGSGSATGTGAVQVNAGTFGGTGNVSGAVTVGSGTGAGASLAPGVKGPGTLTIAKTLTFKSNGSYKCELGLTLHPKVDQVNAKGITIESGAKFTLRTKGTQTLATGISFTVISNTAVSAISGNFANLADGSTFTAGNNTFQVSYEGGAGNDLTLTVVQ